MRPFSALSAYRPSALLAALSLAVWLAAPVWAAPKYTDKENAGALAKVLDKGIYKGHLITSTYIQSQDPARSYLKVVLDNNTSQDWTLDLLHHWSRTGELRLKGNQSLLFPNPDTNQFVVFDKTAFYQKALKAKVYHKRYRDPDPLSGQEIPFGIHRFNLTNLLGSRPATDELGYPYVYVIDLLNGQREFLSQMDAWLLVNRDGLKEAPADGEPVEYRPYRLQKVVAHQADEADAQGIQRFKLEMEFDRNVTLKPNHFPFQLYERSRVSPSQKGPFTIEVVLPNAEVQGRIQPLDHLEYLHDIQAVSSPASPDRSFMQAFITPDVLNSPPKVTVEGKTVTITFFKVNDQTVRDEQAILEADIRVRQEELGKALTQEEIGRLKKYQKAFEEGDSQATLGRDAKRNGQRMQNFLKAVESYNQAALFAITDHDLERALAQRNRLESRLPVMILDYVNRALRAGGGDKAELQGLLDQAKRMSRDRQVQATIRNFEKRLGGTP